MCHVDFGLRDSNPVDVEPIKWTYVFVRKYNVKITFSNECLGSHNDEERSEMRYVMRIARSASHQNFERNLHFPLGSMSVGVSVYTSPRSPCLHGGSSPPFSLLRKRERVQRGFHLCRIGYRVSLEGWSECFLFMSLIRLWVSKHYRRKLLILAIFDLCRKTSRRKWKREISKR